MLGKSKSNYQSIPSDTDESGQGEGLFSRRKLVITISIILLAVAGFWVSSAAENDQSELNWPQYIHKAGRHPTEGFPIFDIELPINTKEAIDLGWVKIEDELCNKKLGEPWRIDGKRSKVTSVTLYFTPEVGDTPGTVVAIENDYYDSVEENLVGTYFKPAAEAEDGTYWSIAVLLRRPTTQGFCDTSHPVPMQQERYFAVAPEMINNVIPNNNNDPAFKESFMEGMCSPGMGFHYFSDVVGGSNLTYEASNLVPVTPMYSSQTGRIQGFYFTATDVVKRQWPYQECGGFGPSTMPCGMSKPGVPPAYNQSMWDWVVPTLWEENMEPFFFCNQFCDPNCGFTGAKAFPELGLPAGFMTMHIFFDVDDEVCEGFQDHHYPEAGAHFYCRDKSKYPPYKSCDGSFLCA